MKLKNKVKVFVSVVLLLALTTTLMMPAAAIEEGAKYNNTVSTSSYAAISSAGKLTVDVSYNGIPGVTTKGVITTYVERRVLGIFWSKVNIGQPNNEWVDTSYNYYYATSHSHQLTKTGTYRITVNYKISGTGGATDNIDYQVTRSY